MTRYTVDFLPRNISNIFDTYDRYLVRGQNGRVTRYWHNQRQRIRARRMVNISGRIWWTHLRNLRKRLRRSGHIRVRRHQVGQQRCHHHVVIFANVFQHIAALDETFVALGTGVRPFVRMTATMRHQVPFACEIFRANVALERSFGR